MAIGQLPHIVLTNPPDERGFTSISQRGAQKRIPNRDRELHSAFLQGKLQRAWDEAEDEQAVYHVTRKGIYLEFKGEQGYELVTKSLEERRSKDSEKWIRLLNIRSEAEIRPNHETSEQEEVETTYATVFVPHNKKKLAQYGFQGVDNALLSLG